MFLLECQWQCYFLKSTSADIPVYSAMNAIFVQINRSWHTLIELVQDIFVYDIVKQCVSIHTSLAAGLTVNRRWYSAECYLQLISPGKARSTVMYLPTVFEVILICGLCASARKLLDKPEAREWLGFNRTRSNFVWSTKYVFVCKRIRELLDKSRNGIFSENYQNLIRHR